MTKKELENRIEALEIRLNACSKFIIESLTIAEAKHRDYIVRTNYLGKITHKQIKDDFKKEIEDKCKDNFNSITSKLLNYEFHFENKDILELFSEILKKYEYKQLIVDTYGTKGCK